MAHADKMPGGYVVRGRSRRGVQGRNYMPVLNRGSEFQHLAGEPSGRVSAYGTAPKSPDLEFCSGRFSDAETLSVFPEHQVTPFSNRKPPQIRRRLEEAAAIFAGFGAAKELVSGSFT
jgi:hypothetical protein